MKTLLIDDKRTPEYIEKEYGIKVDEIARNFADGINALKRGDVGTLLLDHDLASYDEERNELTGYGILVFLEQNREYLPKSTILVTSNPVGRQKMSVVLKKLYTDRVLG